MGNSNQIDRLDLCDILGVTHVLGKYHLTGDDFLNEGADNVLKMGSRVLKLWFYGKRKEEPENAYPFNSTWPSVKTLVEGAKTPYFKKLFAKPFSTFILVVTSLGRPDDYWRYGVDKDVLADEQKQFYELTKYLLTAYRQTGKTFILQHWEGDWAIRGNTNSNSCLTNIATAGMINWLKARQAGVTQSRCEVGEDGVNVYHATEVNRVVESMIYGTPNVVNTVLPHTNVDMVSYSAYDVTLECKDQGIKLHDALDYIASNCHNNAKNGKRNVYIGEFGIPEAEYCSDEVKQVVTNTVQGAIEWGCPYIVYWQLYCNEPKYPSEKIPISNKELMRGFWLIRPDGSKTWAWEYFSGLLQKVRKKPLEVDKVKNIKTIEVKKVRSQPQEVHEEIQSIK